MQGRSRANRSYDAPADRKEAGPAIDEAQWPLVAHLLEPGEVHIENTPCRLLDRTARSDYRTSFFYSIDRAVYVAKPGHCGRIALGNILCRGEAASGETPALHGGQLLNKDERAHFSIISTPSLLSAGLINSLLRTLKERSAGD